MVMILKALIKNLSNNKEIYVQSTKILNMIVQTLNCGKETDTTK